MPNKDKVLLPSQIPSEESIPNRSSGIHGKMRTRVLHNCVEVDADTFSPFCVKADGNAFGDFRLSIVFGVRGIMLHCV
jgi:hypothetical protein